MDSEYDLSEFLYYLLWFCIEKKECVWDFPRRSFGYEISFFFINLGVCLEPYNDCFFGYNCLILFAPTI